MPTLPQPNGHYLLSPDSRELVGFFDAGGHQMRLTRFAVIGGQWEPQGGAFNWTGLMRHSYQGYLQKGYRKP